MVRILIIDDTEIKRENLKALLIEECNIAKENISEASSINEARKLMIAEVFDLVLLDLVMPNYKGEEPNTEDAPNFIDEIYSNPSIKIPNQIIGLTAYVSEFESMKNRFEDKVWHLFHYDISSSDWRRKIKQKVYHLIENKRLIYNNIINRNKHDIGIICALEEEFFQLLSAFNEKWETKVVPELPLSCKSCILTNAYGETLRIIAVCVGKPGMVPTSIIASSMVDIFHVTKLCMTGFAAGIQYDNISLGDIVIAKSIQDYSAGKLIDNKDDGNFKLLHELNIVNASESLLAKARDICLDKSIIAKINYDLSTRNLIKDNQIIKTHISPTVCGPFVVASKEIMDNIKKSADRKLQALDMEGFGLYMVGHFKNCDCLWIKGISDFADSHKGDNFHAQCAYSSAKFLYEMLKESKIEYD